MNSHKWPSVALIVTLSAFKFGAVASAVEVRTYEFVNGQPRSFHLRGGLMDTDLSASLKGSFDIEIADDGAATLARFDVQVVDVLVQPAGGPVWTEGQSLAELLFKTPIGITGEFGPSVTYLSSLPAETPPEEVLSFVGGRTSIKLAAANSPLSTLEITSDLARWIDAPTYQTDAAGFLVQLVPEPTAWLIACSGAIALSTERRRKSA